VISIIFAKGEEERYVFGPFGRAYKCKGPILVKARKGSSPFKGSLIHLSRDTQSARRGRSLSTEVKMMRLRLKGQ
jgi:hypothetical protein